MQQYASYMGHVMVLGLAAAFVYYVRTSTIDHIIFAGAALLAATVPFLIAKWYDVYVPPLIRAGFIAFIVITIILGSLEGFYDRFTWWDTAIHSFAGFGGAIIAYIALAILDQNHLRKTAPWVFSITAVALSVTMSTVWEIFEFAIDGYVDSTMQTNNADTMWDLTGATLAAILAGVIGWQTSAYKKRYDSIFHQAVKDGIRKNEDLHDDA